MGISKTLLYPFSAESPYYEGYAWAVELAVRLNARLQLFTTIGSGAKSSADSIYQSLLEAHGYYLHHFLHEPSRQDRVQREPCISTGEFQEELKKHLKTNDVDIMIIDPAFQSLHAGGLKEIIREAGSAIILSELPKPVEQNTHQAATITEHFYNHLRNAEFYKIPDNFFGSLGQDRSVFNYLRNLFQKNRL